MAGKMIENARWSVCNSVLRGGRLTKYKGKTASYAPGLGVSCPDVSTGSVPVLGRMVSALGASVSARALAAATVLAATPITLSGTAVQAGICVGAVGAYICSGPANDGNYATQVLIPGAPYDLTVTTQAGFGIDTTINVGADDAFTLTGDAGSANITFTDNYTSAITGNEDGISANNNGTGFTLITTTGAVTGNIGNGIDAFNAATTTSLTIDAQGAVTGYNDGIFANQDGSGALSITTQAVTGTNFLGIYADNSNNGTSLTINAQGTVEGRSTGIQVRNNGTGVLSITTQAVIGNTDFGISAYNGGNGTTLTINAQGAVQGGDDGIYAYNRGSGALSITTQAVTSNLEDGIYAYNSGNGTSLTINAQGTVMGDEAGIRAVNDGSGVLSITTQAVTGNSDDGIYAENRVDGTDLTINALAAVSGGDDGIDARNFGSSALSITTQTVTGNDAGIIATNSANGTSLTINVQGAVIANDDGIAAFNSGTGLLSITTQAVTSATDFGINATNSANGTSLTINALGAIISASTGINAVNNGSGALSIDAQAVTGTVLGINALNSGMGAVSITTQAVTGTTLDGIYVSNGNYSTDLTIVAQGAVIGNTDGIDARNNGTGLLSITTQAVTGTTLDGIYVNNGNYTTDLTIVAQGAVSGGDDGIDARNFGSGLLSVTTQAVTGTTLDGIFAVNVNGTSLTINAQAAVLGGNRGIYVANLGSGALSITTQAVTGMTDNGIYANNTIDGTDLTINAQGAVYGGDDGIRVRNDGTGAVSITTQAVTGNSDDGIDARNQNVIATSFTIDAQGAVQGNRDGINAFNNGTGLLSITTQAVTATTNRGIYAFNTNAASTGLTINAQGAVQGGDDGVYARNRGTNLTINAQGTVQGGDDGIFAINEGTGLLSITTQAVTGNADDGISVYNSATGTSIIINAQDAVQGEGDGIRVRNDGTGAVSITSQAVTGNTDDGIDARNQNVIATSLTIDAQGAVQGNRDGINAFNNGTGLLSITTTGAVSGGTGYGITTSTTLGGTTVIALNSGSTVSSAAGLGIYNDAGDSTVTVNTGAAVNGAISLNDGSDDLIFAGGDFSGVTLFDGGDDASTADGFIDTLTFAGSSGAIIGANVVNWERLFIDASSTISFSDNALTVPVTTITNGGTLNAGTIFTLNSELTTSAGGIFAGSGNGAGVFTINGNVTNNGIFTMRDGAAGDRTTINGNYNGTGELLVDVDFSTGMSDVLAVDGNVTGGTTTVTANFLSAGATSGNFVLVVDIAGTSNAADFDLGNPYSGAFAYDLTQIGVDWFLQQTGFNPAVPTYEIYPQVLSELNVLSTLRERTSSRRTSGDSGTDAALGYQSGPGERRSFAGFGGTSDGVAQPAVWARIEGAGSKVDPPVSTAGARFDTSSWKFQAGIDGQVAPNSSVGRWILGISGYLGRASTDVFSPIGNGAISTDSFGLGLTATWYGESGVYVDSQAQFSWFASDLGNVASGTLMRGNDGSGRAFSFEIGKTLDRGNGWAMTPQAQLTSFSIDFDTFTDPNTATVRLDDNDSFSARVGILLEQRQSWNADDGGVRNSSFYALANINSLFSGRSRVNVSGIEFVNSPDRWSGEIGVGGSLDLNNTNATLFGEASVTTSLQNFGDSNRFSGLAGVRVSF